MPHDENDEQADRESLVEEKQRMLANTLAFLEGLQRDGDDASRRYMEDVRASLEHDLRRLERERHVRDQEY